MSTPTRSLALAALLTLPLTAAAGPIDWTYTSTFHAAGQPDMPSVVIGNGGMGAGGSYILSAALQGLTELGYPSNPGIGSDLVVGRFDVSTVNAAYQSPPTWERNFELGVTITDTASGASGTAVFTGYADSTLTTDWPPNPVSLRLTSPANKRLTLGGTYYDVGITSTDAFYDSNGTGAGVVTAHVVLGPANTPEPGTLALAGAGLLGVFGVRRWRKG